MNIILVLFLSVKLADVFVQVPSTLLINVSKAKPNTVKRSLFKLGSSNRSISYRATEGFLLVHVMSSTKYILCTGIFEGGKEETTSFQRNELKETRYTNEAHCFKNPCSTTTEFVNVSIQLNEIQEGRRASRGTLYQVTTKHKRVSGKGSVSSC
jgi:hypothetical protein